MGAEGRRGVVVDDERVCVATREELLAPKSSGGRAPENGVAMLEKKMWRVCMVRGRCGGVC